MVTEPLTVGLVDLLQPGLLGQRPLTMLVPGSQEALLTQALTPSWPALERRVIRVQWQQTVAPVHLPGATLEAPAHISAPMLAERSMLLLLAVTMQLHLLHHSPVLQLLEQQLLLLVHGRIMHLHLVLQRLLENVWMVMLMMRLHPLVIIDHMTHQLLQ